MAVVMPNIGRIDGFDIVVVEDDFKTFDGTRLEPGKYLLNCSRVFVRKSDWPAFKTALDKAIKTVNKWPEMQGKGIHS